MVWLGPRAWTNTLTGSDAFPFDLVAPAEVRSQTIDPLEYRSPWLGPFAAWPESGLTDTPLFRYWRIQPRPETPTEVTLALSGGDPLVVEQRPGLGRAMWILTPPTVGSQSGQLQSWNALPAWPTFVPLVQQQLQYLLSDSMRSSAVLVGEPLPAGWQLASPDASSRRDLSPLQPLQSPGLFVIRPIESGAMGASDVERWLAVQLDPQGGRLTPWPLPQWLESPAALPPPPPGSAPRPPRDTERLRLERWAVGLCLAMLLLESGLGRPAAMRRSE